MRRHSEQPETAAVTSEEFEWVNAWAAQGVPARTGNSAAPRESNVVSLRIVPETDAPRPEANETHSAEADTQAEAVGGLKQPREHQVVLDIIAIMRARDALADTSEAKSPDRGWGSLFVKAHRTADSVPVILGSVMGLLMVIVFSTAAAFVKLAR